MQIVLLTTSAPDSCCPAGATFSRRSPRKSVDRYAKRNENFVLVTVFSGGFEADRIHEFFEIVDDALVEAIQLRSLLLLQFAVG